MRERSAGTKTALEPVVVKPPARAIFEGFDRIFDAITRRAFELFENDGRPFGHELEHWVKAESEFLHPLKINMTESGDAFAIEAEVPGFTAKDLNIEVEGRRLTIRGKRESSEEQKEGKAIYQEHRSNEVLRTITLPSEIDGTKMSAELKNGMLHINVPKSATAKSTRVEVKAA